MVLEMRRAIEALKSGNSQGYGQLYHATCEAAYCRGLLIIRKEDQTMEFLKDFYKDLFESVDEADQAPDMERWFLLKYYQRLRKHYHRLLEKQEKAAPPEGVRTLPEILAAFPLLHRIMLVMSCQDDFTAAEISSIFGLGEEKIQAELDKLKKVFSTLVKDQPEELAAYTENWKLLLLKASRQIADSSSGV